MDPLLKTALVGTAKSPVPAPDDQHPAASILTRLTFETPEQQLLVQAGLNAVIQSAGSVPTQIPSLPSAPEETGFTPSDQATQLLSFVLSPETIDLLPEFLGLMAESNVHFPHRLLPQALDLTNSTRRELLRPVLGERARWLAEFNPNWTWVNDDRIEGDQLLADLQSRWDEGVFNDRVAALQQLRRVRPERARAWLEESIGKEKGDQRRKLLEALRTGLSADDAAFLEKLQSDRAEKVREIVREMLLLIPGSSLAVRMQARGLTVLKANRSMIGKLALSFEPPAECPADWERDGIQPTTTPGLGPRAAAGLQVLAAIPPSFWLQHFACTPQELLTAVRGHEFEEVILEGWLQALQRFHVIDSASLELIPPLWSLYESRIANKVRLDLQDAQLALRLASMTPPATAESIFENLLRSRPDPTELPFDELFRSLPRPWGNALSTAYLKFTRKVFQTRADVGAGRWVNTLLLAALGLHPDRFEDALAPWTVNPEVFNNMRMLRLEEQLRRFGEVIKTRQSFRREVAASSVQKKETS
ncbi:DUF5691 domain-containing protein [Planctomicrobium piriforme]|uniref:Uncharacterized protein n=1 Tax=Planctomicrobium piriforme TaxID=1576369 RepID=A0A1I3FCY7_9PLAN|nr:DUF5691 domain-containing protein [Planctomicrobium piriforme]SFI09050.1 hypothetical protein SAMN05421753_105183 [Planctomicrobium piriforme]